MATEPTADSARDADFANTRWSLVLKAGHPSEADARQALETLCKSYWYPLYAYARRRSADRGEAEDVTQAFFAELLEKNYVATATPERGRFRAFLLTSFKHFLSKHHAKAKAKKRGGGRVPLSLDFDFADSRFRIEPASELTADELFDLVGVTDGAVEEEPPAPVAEGEGAGGIDDGFAEQPAVAVAEERAQVGAIDHVIIHLLRIIHAMQSLQITRNPPV